MTTDPRPAVVSVRFTPAEKAAIEQEAHNLGITVSDLIRRACAAEVAILRRQRAIRDEESRLRTMPHGVSVGNPVSIEVTYVN